MIYEDEDLSRVDFSGAALDGAEFVNCRLIGTRFRSAELTAARFSGCTAFAADSGEAADFSFANLREAHFERCDLTAAEFANVRAYDARFERCQLGGVSFAGADFRLPIGADAELAAFSMRECNFAYGDLSNSFLKGCELIDNRMIEARLDNTVLDEALLRGCDLGNASGRGLSLKGADLRGATFARLDPRSVNLEGVQITLEQAPALLESLGIIISSD